MDIERADVRGLMKNADFIGDLINAIIEDPEIREGLVEDIADDLEDLIEEDPEIAGRIIGVAMAGDGPKRNEGGYESERIEDIRGVGAKTAIKMRQCGYDTVQQVAETNLDDMKNVGLPASVARLIIDSAREMTREQRVMSKIVPERVQEPVEGTQIKHRILSASKDNQYFRKKVVAHLVKEMQ